MHSGRLELADAVHREGRFMRNDGTSLRPQGPASEVVVDVGYPLGQAEQATVDAQPVAGTDMVGLSLVGVPDRFCLGRAEVPGLFGGQSKQPTSQVPPVGNNWPILYDNLIVSDHLALKL